MRKLFDFLMMLLLGAGCLLFTWVVSGGVIDSNMVYNLVFLGTVIILYFFGVILGFFKIYNLSIYFSHAGDIISQLVHDDKPYVKVESRVKSLKGYTEIDTKLDEFLDDLKKSQSGICDIEDYINYNEIDKLVHKWYLDLAPNIMTSLGILGTFVGLVWGLRAFDTTGLDTMTSSVTSLIDGIKVAFLTSIYGLVCSLVFQYTTNKGYAKLLGYVQDFLDKFHMFIVPSASIDAQNRLVHSQRGQYEMMKTLGVEFSESMAGGLMQNLNPTLKKLDSTLDELATSRMDTTDKDALYQELLESIRRLSETSESNDRLINMFAEISQRTEEINSAILENQKDISEALKLLSQKGGVSN